MAKPGDAFAERNDAWRLQVIRDARITRVPLAVAIIISQRVNRETDDAWPALDKIAKQCGTTIRSIRRAIDCLEEHGHVAVIRGGGRKSNRYRLAMKDDPICAPIGAQKDGDESAPTSAQNEPECAPTSAQNSEQSKLSFCAPTGAASVRPSAHRPLNTSERRKGESPLTPQLQEAFDAWNELADECGLPRVQDYYTRSRPKHLGARLHDIGGIEGWRLVLTKVRQAPYLLGQINPDWRCSFDWLVTRANFAKVVEGNYRDRRRSGGDAQRMSNQEWADQADEEIQQ